MTPCVLLRVSVSRAMVFSSIIGFGDHGFEVEKIRIMDRFVFGFVCVNFQLSTWVSGIPQP